LLRSQTLRAWSVLFSLSASAVPPSEALEKVSQRRIFFGHQSVGADIVEGLTEVAAGRLAIKESRAPEAFDTPAFVHTRIGTNEAPRSKVADFEAALEQLGPRVDIAFFKFCYVDVTERTDLDALFGEYQAAMARLREKFPRVLFVHVTVPLTVVQSGPRAWLRRARGAAPAGALENAARHRFNQRLRAAYAGEPLFDLAALEARWADGATQQLELEGVPVPSLVPSWTDDGQHLNASGRRRVAASLLSFLGSLP
jgi:lysophospholipase L1-like esterase